MIVIGAFDDLGSVRAALQGVYGVWVNTDGFTVGEQKETWAGIHIFEIAKEIGTVKHYVYSGLDYVLKVCQPLIYQHTFTDLFHGHSWAVTIPSTTVSTLTARLECAIG